MAKICVLLKVKQRKNVLQVVEFKSSPTSCRLASLADRDVSKSTINKIVPPGPCEMSLQCTEYATYFR